MFFPEVVKEKDISVVLSAVEDILLLNRAIESALRRHCESANGMIQEIAVGGIFVRHIPFLKTYSPFVCSLKPACHRLHTWSQSLPRLKSLLYECEKRGKACSFLSDAAVHSLLLDPQMDMMIRLRSVEKRISEYFDIFVELRSLTSSEHFDFHKIFRCCDLLADLKAFLSDSKQDAENVRRVSSEIMFEKSGDSRQFISRHRKFVKEGELGQFTSGNPAMTPFHIFLFCDLLLVCSIMERKDEDSEIMTDSHGIGGEEDISFSTAKYKMLETISVSRIVIQDLTYGDNPDEWDLEWPDWRRFQSFRITFDDKQMTFCASSVEDKAAWIRAISDCVMIETGVTQTAMNHRKGGAHGTHAVFGGGALGNDPTRITYERPESSSSRLSVDGRDREDARDSFSSSMFSVPLSPRPEWGSSPPSPVFGRMSEDGLALHMAAYADSVPMIRRLVSKGVDVSLVDHQKGWSALHVCACYDRIDAATSLIELGIDIELRDISSRTALFVACMEQNVRMIDLLADHGANVNVRDGSGFTSLMLCSLEGYQGSCESLLRHGASVRLLNENGRSALHYAVSMKRHGIVQLLVRHGAWINQPDHQEQSPLDMALEMNEFRAVAYLLKCGARGNRPDTMEKNLWKACQKIWSMKKGTYWSGTLPPCILSSERIVPHRCSACGQAMGKSIGTCHICGRPTCPKCLDKSFDFPSRDSMRKRHVCDGCFNALYSRQQLEDGAARFDELEYIEDINLLEL
eukprot:TRINITY_DN3167_c0_g1_i1.p1 TRINITY_DN3167_c0_g1~~TRINITY_DN3167_c0_g1_i1.p1  ORF type:complete len:744 (+),score=167.24 TRINITY_DN3167_c0_g1_i1:256-2487(+)